MVQDILELEVEVEGCSQIVRLVVLYSPLSEDNAREEEKRLMFEKTKRAQQPKKENKLGGRKSRYNK